MDKVKELKAEIYDCLCALELKQNALHELKQKLIAALQEQEKAKKKEKSS